MRPALEPLSTVEQSLWHSERAVDECIHEICDIQLMLFRKSTSFSKALTRASAFSARMRSSKSCTGLCFYDVMRQHFLTSDERKTYLPFHVHSSHHPSQHREVTFSVPKMSKSIIAPLQSEPQVPSPLILQFPPEII